MKQTTIDRQGVEQLPSRAALRLHSRNVTPFAAISMRSSATAALLSGGYPCVDAGAAAIDTCTFISKRPAMNWAGRPMGSRGSPG